MARRKQPSIPDALLGQLLDGTGPRTAFNPDGVLEALKKALAERMLNAGRLSIWVARAPPGAQTPATAMARRPC
jgi:hypothetical protein